MLLARASFDHLVDQREQCGRHGEAERIRGLTINNEFELCRQLDGICASNRLISLKMHAENCGPLWPSGAKIFRSAPR
jgi:hypothetical protein